MAKSFRGVVNMDIRDSVPGTQPCAFTGGTLHRLAVDVSGEPYLDLERKAVAMLSANSRWPPVPPTRRMTTCTLDCCRAAGWPTEQAIVAFVNRVSGEDGPPAVPVEERVAVFDNDGTLWCEQPMPIQLDFILRRLVAMAEAQPELRDRQPWKAAYERDYGWLSALMAEHYAGNDTNVRTLAGGILAAYAGISVDDFEQQSDGFLRTAQHPTLGRGYLECAYTPMIELLDYLAANGFSNYIASGGRRDFMQPISQDVYGIPRERVIAGAPPSPTPATTTAAPSPTSRRPITSTTGRRSRYGSGTASAAVRCSRPATPTAISRCSSSPITPTSPRCAFSSGTTTQIANSTTRPAPSRRSSKPKPPAGRSSASRTIGPPSSHREPPPPTVS